MKGVVLAIATFRTTDHVASLLRSVFTRGGSSFGAVVVVDSLGDGTLARIVTENNWPVTYYNADQNLGSAGNLRKRLEVARSLGGRWCYAINHDGEVDVGAVEAMVRVGESAERIGAVYPNRFRANRGASWEAPRVGRLPRIFSPRLADRPTSSGNVIWSSSNGALYNLEPAAEGVEVWDDLWMGWEDLGYGLRLNEKKWRQVLCSDAVFTDTYEYRRVYFFGKAIYVANKPEWYAYYNFRNLILIARRVKGGLGFLVGIVPIMAKELVVTVLYRPRPLVRLRLLLQGMIDGFRNISGKGQLP